MPRTKKTETETEEADEADENKTTKKKTAKAPESELTAETAKSTSDERIAKLAKLKEKAKKLESAVESKEIDLKKKVKSEEEEKKDTLVPIEDYLKSSIHLGTRAITPDMKPYVYKRRADSLAVFNTALLDEKIKEGALYLAQYSPDQIIVVCKREAGHHAVDLFSRTTGIKAFTKKYPAGILTNSKLDNFLEAELVLICDPWTDKNSFNDALRIKIPVLGICDTNNYTMGITKVIPGNNKSAKSLGMIFYLLTKIYVEKRGLKVEVPPVQEFIDGWDSLIPPK
ncbi:MAG: 30S ribosomal protein S2 [Nanoarchaeota archaeon]|nr:30S ribosomal protein S2 [Nanoarchaeota archaeon]